MTFVSSNGVPPYRQDEGSEAPLNNKEAEVSSLDSAVRFHHRSPACTASPRRNKGPLRRCTCQNRARIVVQFARAQEEIRCLPVFSMISGAAYP